MIVKISLWNTIFMQTGQKTPPQPKEAAGFGIVNHEEREKKLILSHDHKLDRRLFAVDIRIVIVIDVASGCLRHKRELGL